MKKQFIAAIVVFGLSIGCEVVKESPSFEVKHAGALRDVMQKGDITAKITLSEIENLPHVYALGAVENLKGEIFVFDGKPFVASVKDSVLKIDKNFSGKANLLVYAQVEQWQKVNIPPEIGSVKALEAFVQEKAAELGLDVEAPFPFLLRGEAARIEWHVIDWPEGDVEHTHAKHKTSGLNGVLENDAFDIVGFYSNKHHGVFTHHSTNIHLHFKNSDDTVSGHVDDLALDGRLVLYLPTSQD